MENLSKILSCREMALHLVSQGKSVIPLRPKDKRPNGRLLPDESWTCFQSRIATPEEVETWFRLEPKSNIGLVCGAISGVVVVDIDGDEGASWFRTNIPDLPNLFQYTSSKSKFHAIYASPKNGERVPPKVRIASEVDIRGDGSYIVLAPSIHPSGAQYSIHALETFSSWESLVDCPNIDLLSGDDGKPKTSTSEKGSTFVGTLVAGKGERNSKLASLAGRQLAKGSTVEETMCFALGWNANFCNPPLPQNEVERTVQSMASTHARNNPETEKPVTDDSLRAWVDFGPGEFQSIEIDRDLGLKSPEQKRWRTEVLQKLVEEGKIERTGKDRGRFRVRDLTMTRIDLNESQPEEVKILFPFGLSNFVRVQQKNIIAIAGETNSGKTSFLFNVCWLNANKPIRYLSSEMQGPEIMSRVKKFGAPTDRWGHVEFIYRADDFHDIIDPDGINIIDYLEIYGDFWRVGEKIKKIFDALKTGIAIIATQKRTGETYGRGGEFGLEKARVGISLFCHGKKPSGIIGSAKITKAKNFVEGKNPEGREIFYSLEDGYYYDAEYIESISPYSSGWRYFDQKDREALASKIDAHCKQASNEVTLDGNAYGETTEEQPF